MENIKAVIFDLDGVLCSTDRYHYCAWKELADTLGIYFDSKINDKLRGISRMESLDIILGEYKDKYSLKEKEKMAEKKNAIYRQLLEGMSREELSDAVYKTLMNLKSRGLKLAVGSSSKNARFILDKIGLTDFFDAVADGTQIRNSKPDPEVFLLAASLINVAPENTVVVEDAESGITAAKRGGFKTVGINVNADQRISSFSELESYVL